MEIAKVALEPRLKVLVPSRLWFLMALRVRDQSKIDSTPLQLAVQEGVCDSPSAFAYTLVACRLTSTW